jgi:hypothetical protein
MSDSYALGTYVKNGRRKTAGSRRDAVALVFDGYKLEKPVVSEEATYRDLQAQAKELGIAANQSESALREAIALKAPAQGVAPAPSSTSAVPDTIEEPHSTLTEQD